jgi:hypothetical protein
VAPQRPLPPACKTSRFTISGRTWLLVTGLAVCFAGGSVLSGPDWICGVFAVVVALAGVRRWDQRPALAFSVVSQTTNAVVVEIDANSAAGKRAPLRGNTRSWRGRTPTRYSTPVLRLTWTLAAVDRGFGNGCRSALLEHGR